MFRSALLVLFPCYVFAQPTSCELVLSGHVSDEHDRSGLGFAEVRVLELARSVQADELGAYRIDWLCSGTYTLQVAHLGCDPVTVKVQVSRSMAKDLFLEHHGSELRDLEVIRKRPDENVGLSRTELDKVALESSTGRTLAEALSNIPGVNMLSSGPTINKPVIHGLYGNRILTLNQGIRQEDQQWGTEHAPNLDPFSSDRITVVKGAASVQYGADAMGGVIITEPVELPREGGERGEVRGVGLWNGRGVGGNGSLQGTVTAIRGLGWRVQGGGRYIGDAQAPAYVLSNTGMRESGGSAALGWHRFRGGVDVFYSYFARELGILRASHIGNLTDLRNAIESGDPWYQAPFTYTIEAPRQSVRHHLLKVESSYRITDRNELVLTYGYQADDRQEFDIRRGGRSERPAIDLWLVTHTGDAVFKHFIGKHVHGKVGANGVLQRNSNLPGTGIRPLIPDFQKSSGGVFVLEHMPLGDRLEFEAGARLEVSRLEIGKYDNNDAYITPEHAFVNHAFSVGVNRTFADSAHLRANVSSAYRPPQVSELYSEGLHHGSAAIEIGDPSLASERSLKATIDLNGRALKSKLEWGATVYFDRIANYIYLRPQGYQLTIRGAFPEFAYVATDALLWGLDLSGEFAVGPHWALRSRWSFVRGRDRKLDEWLFQMPSDRGVNSLVWRSQKVGGWRAIEASAISTLVFEQTRFPVGLDFTTPPPGYQLLGFSFSASKPLGKNELRIGIQGSNLLNMTYRDYLDRFRYFADARGSDVSVMVRYSWGAPPAH
ncbi:MAG: TonB-dependent receptor [Flavobacteriales bacterium]|nr:TonB-dependent receptor [Flavobacteriales bacterium]